MKTALTIRAFLLLVFLMDIAAVMLLFDAAKKLGSNKSRSFFILILFSTVLIPFELWREGMHYDHHTIFFTSLFAWSLVKLITNKNSFGNALLVSVAGGLLVAQSAANSAIVPVSLVLIVSWLYFPERRFKQLIMSLIVVLMLPAIVLIAVSKKNQSVSSESLTSNKGGPAMMMVVQRAYHYDVNGIRNLVKESGAPDWYTWTYDHATPPVDPATGKPSYGWMNLAQAFGICFYPPTKENKNVWNYNFDPLLNYLKQNGPINLVAAVEADSADAVNKPYRFAGYSPELSPRWIGIYGDVSKKIFFKAIEKNPVGMFRSFFIQQGIFAAYGPLFPYNAIKNKPSLLARSGIRSLRSSIPLQPLFIFAALLFAILGWITYLSVLLNIPAVIIDFFKPKNQKTTGGTNVFLLLSIPVILLAIVYSCLVGGENDRYFMQATPYIVILATLIVPGIGSNKKRTVAV